MDPPPSQPLTTSRLKSTFADRLDEAGVLDFLADTITNLYLSPKAPPEIYSYFLSLIQTSESPDVEKLLQENQELRKTISSLKAQVADLESKLKK